MNINELTPDAKVVLYIQGVVDDLARMELLGKPRTLSPKGTAAFDQLHSSGFRPDREDIPSVLRALGKFRDKEDEECMVTLVCGWMDGKIKPHTEETL